MKVQFLSSLIFALSLSLLATASWAQDDGPDEPPLPEDSGDQNGADEELPPPPAPTEDQEIPPPSEDGYQEDHTQHYEDLNYAQELETLADEDFEDAEVGEFVDVSPSEHPLNHDSSVLPMIDSERDLEGKTPSVKSSKKDETPARPVAKLNLTEAKAQPAKPAVEAQVPQGPARTQHRDIKITAYPQDTLTTKPSTSAVRGTTMASAELSRKQVKALQSALNKNGAKLKVDGRLGATTALHLLKFQAKSGLKQSGQPDSATLAKLGIAR